MLVPAYLILSFSYDTALQRKRAIYHARHLPEC